MALALLLGGSGGRVMGISEAVRRPINQRALQHPALHRFLTRWLRQRRLPCDVHRTLARELGLAPSQRKSQLWWDIKATLARLVDEQHTVPVTIIDEGQHLSDRFLEDLAGFSTSPSTRAASPPSTLPEARASCAPTRSSATLGVSPPILLLIGRLSTAQGLRAARPQHRNTF